MKPEIMWFIGGTWSNGKPFLYCGGTITRSGAIKDHEAATGRTWADLKRSGDYAVKCRVSPLEGHAQRTPNEGNQQ